MQQNNIPFPKFISDNLTNAEAKFFSLFILGRATEFYEQNKAELNLLTTNTYGLQVNMVINESGKDKYVYCEYQLRINSKAKQKRIKENNPCEHDINEDCNCKIFGFTFTFFKVLSMNEYLEKINQLKNSEQSLSYQESFPQQPVTDDKNK